MDILINFLLNNYIWFLVISLILIFALIGYLVDTTSFKKKNNLEKKDNLNNLEKADVYPND